MHRNHDDDQFGDKATGRRDAAHNPGSRSSHSHQGQGHSDASKSHLIGDALKSVYRNTLEEDIPDDFLSLLNQLK